MRVTIDINEQLLNEAMVLSGAATEHEVIDKALRLLVKLAPQSEVRQWRGRLKWAGDLGTSRQGRKLWLRR